MYPSNNFLLNKNNHSLLNEKNENSVFREYKKDGDAFIASDNFYIENKTIHKTNYRKCNSLSNIIEEINNNVYEYSGDRIQNDLYSYIDKKYINLLVINDIEFSIDEININKKELFKKFIENDKKINELLLKDFYYNETFSNKINIALPKNIKNKGDKLDKIYLFKIKLDELQCGYSIECNNI